MPQVELVKDPEGYFQLLTCQSIQVKNSQFVNDEGVEVYYARGDDFIATSDKTNVYETKNGKTVCNLRDFTLNHRGSKKINFDNMCEQVCRPNGESICLEIPNFIKRDPKTKTLHSVQLKKKYNLA